MGIPRNSVLAIVSMALLSGNSALAQPSENAEHRRLKTGVLTGVYARHGESFDGANGALGAWATFLVEKWGIDVDFSRSRRLERSGFGCVDLSCTRSVPLREFEANSAIGVTAFRELRTAGHASPHFIIGYGAISRQTGHRFDDPALGEQPESAWWASGPVAGMGVDIVMGHVVARAQYRLNLRVEHSIHQFRIGFGWVR